MNDVILNKVLAGKLLGEIYRVQRKLEIPTIDDARIDALCNGVEKVIDQEMEAIGFISNAKIEHTADILQSIKNNSDKFSSFKGFYDIEKDLEKGGVDRSDAIRIIQHFNKNGYYSDVIEKMDSEHSPIECRTFN